ncbi:glycosyltransferase family 4 protein [bacterium]|nr:glycosyltransferase family 4 protein [bacterium]
MRIAHVITRLIVGGAQENTVATVEDHVQQDGDDVALITGPPLGPEGSLIPRAEQSGCELIVMPELARSIHPLREVRAYRQLKKKLREYQPDIVHTHSSKAGILGRRAAFELKLPCVHTIHGAAFHYGQSPLAYHLYRQAERTAEPWCDHIISVADAMSQQYLAAGIGKPEKYTTIYSGFDVEPFLDSSPRTQLRQEWGVAEDEILVGKIGRLFPLKGHEAILDIAPHVVQVCPKVRFVFIGDGILREQYEAEIREAGLEKHFLLTGLVPPSEIPRLMQGLDVVVHTSQWEGLARVLPQGLVSGKPVVSYDIDGAREVVRDHQTGFLVERDDRTRLKQAIIELAHNPSLRARFGEKGRELCVRMFDRRRMTEQIREVYCRVLADRGLPAVSG